MKIGIRPVNRSSYWTAMQSNYWPAASASSKPDSSTAADTTNIKQISLVIIRLELDNCVDEEDPILLSSPERDINTIFNYHCEIWEFTTADNKI